MNIPNMWQLIRMFAILVSTEIILSDVTNQEDNTTNPIVEANVNTFECKNWYLYKNHCYKVFTNQEYYRIAAKDCQKYNGNLVSITSEDEKQFIVELMKRYTKENKVVWIGLTMQKSGWRWEDNRDCNDNCTLDKADHDEKCAVMVTTGDFVGKICYHRFPFVCKKAKETPPPSSMLAIYLNIAIPLSCVFIMFIFVGFLCYKSHQELAQIQEDNVDGKPFEIVQAAMILPMKKAPDLMNNNKGKNLWKGAIEKLRQEQNKNNPLNDPSTFLTRRSQSEIANNNNNNNNSILNNSQDSTTLADIVNQLVKRQREIVTSGMLGAPTTLQNIPSISINRCGSVDSEEENYHDKTDKKRRRYSSNDSYSGNDSGSQLSDSKNTQYENAKRDVIVTKWLKSSPSYMKRKSAREQESIVHTPVIRNKNSSFNDDDPVHINNTQSSISSEHSSNFKRSKSQKAQRPSQSRLDNKRRRHSSDDINGKQYRRSSNSSRHSQSSYDSRRKISRDGAEKKRGTSQSSSCSMRRHSQGSYSTDRQDSVYSTDAQDDLILKNRYQSSSYFSSSFTKDSSSSEESDNRKSNLVEVVVDVNHKVRAKNNQLQNKNNGRVNKVPTEKSPKKKFSSQHQYFDLIISEASTSNDSFIKRHPKSFHASLISTQRRKRRSKAKQMNSFSSAVSIDQLGKHGTFNSQYFRDLLRRESLRRKDRYFPQSTPDITEIRDFTGIPLPPLIQKNKHMSEYTTITMV